MALRTTAATTTDTDTHHYYSFLLLLLINQMNQGMVNALDELRARKLPFAIATTSPKPRVPASIHACGLDDYFPADKVHSGESDFDPPASSRTHPYT